MILESNIKEVIILEDKNKVVSFLKSFNLKYENDIIKTFFIEIDDEIIGTISCNEYIIKDLAINPSYQGESIANILISKIIDYFRVNNIYSYQVYTKLEYEQVFLDFGFNTVIKTDKVVLLEGGVNSINKELDKIKKQIEITFGPITEDLDIASIVINGNPYTIGHDYLVQQASINHKIVLLFVLEEDISFISFKERIAMAYLATRKYSNVLVLSSTKFIVSKLTFPTYFLKEEDINTEMAYIDALIFKNYFMKNLFIKKRYVGSEVKDKMVSYNEILRTILKDSLVVIPRLEVNNIIVSASLVRKLLQENRSDAYNYIPNECKMLIKGKKL